ncbi:MULTISPECIES: tRNA dihydrouridine synthase DusB [Kocuria]|uniref:tRNA-dihydrouridine synthase n=1 Tax=Kocuria marina subsp. indica TaxID=1049583 RepID=A0A1X7CUT4_9MICC|nr:MULTISPECIES: tRNA dihydrouridine synthase DusB [Kocuria]MBN6812072.1 tRNA dihydrouridine synthase DusB [Kocuria indica]MBN6843766.1 tRNA dihydrouridine synthase DusB [Kocuria indica]MCG7431379.1 tRNA dihydrouridine synthase DusB [Kocuria indica]MCT1722931.1 tRNA dihydrouridine synthase DusB [Kocuria marina]MCT1734251.1 tRNA dihydrouridine synthase DusB [Kocuria marina]
MSTETTETADREPAVLNLKPLQLGRLTVDVPVVLAPMAGVTNKSFRTLCREYGGGLYVTEMVTARALVERRPESLRIIDHDPHETPRSIQIYGVDAVNVGKAVRMVAQEDRADHIDLNFGCPVPKVTKRGGGSALPWKTDLFRAIIRTAVREAGEIPVTVKMRIGIDGEHQTFLDAGRMARDEGIAAVALHGRTLEQHYSGHADWDAIARLREALPDIPVLGNGDIFSAEDAVRMVEHTGVDGVVVGRGCQGRPWLFGDLQAAFEGSPRRYRPGVRKVAETVYRHAELLTQEFGDELKGCREIRKHVSWYFKGYPVGGQLRARMAQVPTLAALRELLDELDLDAPYPGADVEGPRGRAGSPKKPHLPDGWLDSRILGDAERLGLAAAELDVSGG